GEIDQIDERCDVFGLGAILCEILTGRPPYYGTPTKVRAQAKQGQVLTAHQRLDGCGADTEIVTLAKACLAADPAGRRGDAGAVAAAISAYQQAVEERLRAAETERAAAQARVAAEQHARELAQGKALAEQRRRRLAVVLATVVILAASALLG